MGYPEAQYIVDEINTKLDTEIKSDIESLIIASMAAIQCCGVIGQTFTLTNNNTGDVKKHTISENDDMGADIYREKRIYVPLGTWNVHTSIPDLGETTGTIEVTQIGYVYTFTYEILIILQEFTSNGTFTVPENIDHVFIDAAAGGGSGGGGYVGANAYYCNGGGGGGGGDCIVRKRYFVEPLSAHAITIGTGGAAVAYETHGNPGGSTVIGSLVTLVGGSGGDNWSSGGAAGGSGAGAGGAGGPGNGSSYKAGSAGKPSAAGISGGSGGAVAGSGDGGGGGGGSLGKGGNGGGGSSQTSSTAGTEGGGGGGGFGYLNAKSANKSKMTGSKGGNGVVRIYKGVVVA